MMHIFSDQMKDLERDLRKEKEAQDALLKKKLKGRTRQAKKAQVEVEKREKDKTDVILSNQEQINELQLKKDQIEENGIKTKALKHERENEF